jgi:D-beta-D-heptose 7-phosphate kinase/D-beta-D-heptose 1-phosphate adenosyltransferase
VLIIANSDCWLRRKKGFVFMPFEERVEILQAVKGVLNVVCVDDSDNTVCNALREFRPDAFANGGDRKQANTPEMDVCNELSIEMIWNVGGEKIQSSSSLVNKQKRSQDGLWNNTKD